MRMKTVGNKRDIVALVIRNNSGVSMPSGTPINLELTGTNDGLDVVLPSSSAAKADVLGFGVVLNAIADQQYGEAQVFGFCNNITLLRQTRAASTDAFSSNSDGFSLIGVLLNIDTVNNAFSTSGGTMAKSGFLPFAVLAATVASWASSASATSDTRTALTVASKAFLRMM
jgi:hypothetical protein